MSFQACPAPATLQNFFLVDLLVILAFRHLSKVFETLDRSAYSAEVSQHTAQPAVIDKRHTTTPGFFTNRFAGSTLGADKHDFTFFGSDLAEVIHRVLAQGHGLLEIDDMDLVALAENKGSHFGVPETGLVTEMHARFQHFTHGDVRHKFLQMSLWIAFVIGYPGLSLHIPDVYDLFSGKIQAPINALRYVCVV